MGVSQLVQNILIDRGRSIVTAISDFQVFISVSVLIHLQGTMI